MSREKAQEKIEEWFTGVTKSAFEAAVKTVAQHQAAGFSPSTVV